MHLSKTVCIYCRCIIFLSLLALFPSCQFISNNPGSVMLVCDDSNVDNWFRYRDSFLKYQVHVTFYVSHYHQLDASKKAKLKILQKDGHEIGYHTLSHLNADSVRSGQQLERYVDVELDSGLQLMQKDGFNPQTFAFPYSKKSPALIDSVNKRFKISRIDQYGFFEYWERKDQYRMQKNDSSVNFIPYSIDSASLFYDRDQWIMILQDLRAGNHVSLLFHSIGQDSPYSTNSTHFMEIIREMHQSGIIFKTVGEFYGYGL